MAITVSRSGAAFGYGPDGAIFEIADDLPEAYWAHPANAWSPLIASRIPWLEGVRLKYEGSHLSGSFKDRIMAATRMARCFCADLSIPSGRTPGRTAGPAFRLPQPGVN